jgi:hypothetical protein
MVKMIREGHKQVTMREVQKRLMGDDADEIRRIGEQLGFEAEANWWVEQATGSVDEFKNGPILMLKKRAS